MKPMMLRRYLLAIVLGSSLTAPLSAQWKQKPSTGSPVERFPDRTTLVGQAGLGPFLDARLVDEAENARRHRAHVNIETDGVIIMPPEQSPTKLDEAWLQYRLDSGAFQAINDKNLHLEDLSAGRHRLQVRLADADNKPKGKIVTLTFSLPR